MKKLHEDFILSSYNIHIHLMPGEGITPPKLCEQSTSCAENFIRRNTWSCRTYWTL